MSDLDPELIIQLQEAFAIEAREQLQSIMSKLIEMEKVTEEAAAAKLSEGILHDLHSMKGNARAAGVASSENICQLFESALLSLRRRKENLTAESADVFHAAVDLLDEIICKVEAQEADHIPPALAQVLHRLRALDERRPEDTVSQLSAPDMLIPLEAGQAQSGQAQSGQPQSGQLQSGQAQAGQAQSGQARAGQAQSGQAQAGQAQVAQAQAGQVQAGQVESGASATQSASKSAGSSDKSASTRIALWKLDRLLQESEEMLILKQMAEQNLVDTRELKTIGKNLKSRCLQLRSLSRKSGSRESLRDRELSILIQALDEISETLEQAIGGKMRRQQTEQRLCSNLVDGFIDSVKSLLMQDFSGLLALVPKLVRDLSRELNKELDLEIFGAEIEIDRRILEEIKDPLIHIIRNSLDHGIENPEERQAKGKPARAQLRVGARQDESGNVQLIIKDDGKGINLERLKAAAVKAGHISESEAATLSKQEALDLMYHSAVSTSQQVTNISGRGIGMAIVRDRIHELGGRVLVESEVNQGTCFILQLPTKLSTFRGIQILAGTQSFIIPTLSVYYAGRILRSDIKANGRRNVVNINGQLTSVQSLADVLDMRESEEFRSSSSRKYQQILVLEHANRRAGFLVDEILQEHEVLVRGFSYPLVRVNNISGATILGSGQVLPVLNVADLMETSLLAENADARLTERLRREQDKARSQSESTVFLVDQQATSRIMLKTVLESEGYRVKTFASTEAACKMLDEESPLIWLTNYEQFELEIERGVMAEILRMQGLGDLPVVFFGSHTNEEGSRLAQDKGGKAYFSKLDFNRNRLLELIERLT